MEITDFVLCAQRIKPLAYINVEIQPNKTTLTVSWLWKESSDVEKSFKRAILLKELNYDEAINAFFTHCRLAIEGARGDVSDR